VEKIFNKKHAEEILAPCDIADYIKIDERGVWPSIPRDNLAMDEADADDLRWTPARVFKFDGNSPEASETPSIPFPFSECELAAFMVEGIGAK